MIPHSRIVAHRGLCRDHTENTLQSIVAAIDGGCAAVEFDVRRTADDQWVVYHDVDLVRLHDRDLVIDQHPLSVIHDVAAPPLLTAVLDCFDRNSSCVPLIEVKQLGVEGLNSLCGIIAGCPASKVIIARGPDAPRELARRLPSTPVFLYTRDWDEADRRQGEGLAGYDLWREGIALGDAKQRIDRLRSTGQRVAVWTINTIDEAQHWIDAGADFVITDVPWVLG